MASLVKNAGIAAYPLNPAFSVGKKQRVIRSNLTFATTGANGDKYVLAGPFSMDTKICRILGNSFPALTSATDNDLGFAYSKDKLATLAGLVALGNGNELMDGVSLASASTVYKDYLTAWNSSLDTSKSIRDLLSLPPDKEPPGGVYLVLTVNTAQSAGGTADLDVVVEDGTSR